MMLRYARRVTEIFTTEEDKEINSLVEECRALKFNQSIQVSRYIVKNKLGYKYRLISGYVDFENQTHAWTLKGGIAPRFYREVCRRLRLANLQSKARVVGFRSFKDSNFS